MIGLHSADNTTYPNLALMKLSAHYKNLGHETELYVPLKAHLYEKVFSSQVFTYSQDIEMLPECTIRGGGGHSSESALQDNIEHTCPDYDLYDLNYSIGFLTRGCVRNCYWCPVREREGTTRENADYPEFVRHKDVVLLDNNILSHSHGINQLEKISDTELRIDINQGVDVRFIDGNIAKLFSKIKWLKPIRLACDDISQIEDTRKAIELLRWHNATPRAYFCYVMIRDIDEALEIIKFLKSYHIDAFAQPYIDKAGTKATVEQKNLARWVNHKAEFYSRTWEEYKEAACG